MIRQVAGPTLIDDNRILIGQKDSIITWTIPGSLHSLNGNIYGYHGSGGLTALRDQVRLFGNTDPFIYGQVTWAIDFGESGFAFKYSHIIQAISISRLPNGWVILLR